MERETVGWCQERWATPDEDILFDDSLLQQFDCTNMSCYTQYGVSIQNPGPGLTLRSLQKSDYSKGYISLLSQLTKTGEISKEDFDTQFEAMKRCPGVHYVIVIEDLTISKVIGTCTLLVERKFTHNVALRGRIEDLVVDGNYRGKHLGNLIVESLTELSQYIGCYKTSLDCLPVLKSYYEKFMYENTSILFMSRRFYD